MKKYLLLFAIVFSVGTAFASKVSEIHLKGYIDDSHCAASKTPMCTPATRVNCANKCIKLGSTAVLVADGKVYKIANQKAVLKFAGKNVSIDGKITNDTIEVNKNHRGEILSIFNILKSLRLNDLRPFVLKRFIQIQEESFVAEFTKGVIKGKVGARGFVEQ